MPFRWNVQEHVSLLRHLAKWLLLSIPLGLLVGLAVAGFLKCRWPNYLQSNTLDYLSILFRREKKAGAARVRL